MHISPAVRWPRRISLLDITETFVLSTRVFAPKCSRSLSPGGGEHNLQFGRIERDTRRDDHEFSRAIYDETRVNDVFVLLSKLLEGVSYDSISNRKKNKTMHHRTRHCARVYRIIFTYTFHSRGKSQIYVNCVAQWYRIAFIEFENSNKARYSTTWRLISNRRDAFEHFQQREGREREKQWETPPSLLV